MTSTVEGLGNKRKTGTGWLVWVKRLFSTLLITLIVLSLLGMIYQSISTKADQKKYPAPGQLIDIGGYRLHLYCMGDSKNGSPTVILEQGLGGTSPAWALIQPEVAKVTRVCSYDRAGLGWSDP